MKEFCGRLDNFERHVHSLLHQEKLRGRFNHPTLSGDRFCIHKIELRRTLTKTIEAKKSQRFIYREVPRLYFELRQAIDHQFLWIFIFMPRNHGSLYSSEGSQSIDFKMRDYVLDFTFGWQKSTDQTITCAPLCASKVVQVGTGIQKNHTDTLLLH